MNDRPPNPLTRATYALADAILARNVAKVRATKGRHVPPEESARIDAEVAACRRGVEAAQATKAQPL
jgi:hypothetical protein